MTTIRLHLLPRTGPPIRSRRPTSMQAAEALRYGRRLWTLQVDRCPKWNGGDGRATAEVDPVPLREPTSQACDKARQVSLIVEIQQGDVVCVDEIEFVVTGSPAVPELRLVDNEDRKNGAADQRGS